MRLGVLHLLHRLVEWPPAYPPWPEPPSLRGSPSAYMPLHISTSVHLAGHLVSPEDDFDNRIALPDVTISVTCVLVWEWQACPPPCRNSFTSPLGGSILCTNNLESPLQVC